MVSTILSVHSSHIMIDHAPMQTVIWDLQMPMKKNLDANPFSSLVRASICAIHSLNHYGLLPFTKIVAPHREAFHRTSLILQYINARILQLLMASMAWDGAMSLVPCCFIVFTCRRMIPDPWTLDYRNGNTFCFVLPMVLSVMGDCGMTTYMEWRNGMNGTTTCRWLSLRALAVVQFAGLMIAFLFTLAFRSNKRKKASATAISMSIRPLYYVTAAGVYLLIAIGITKATHDLKTCDT
jgi:hypothetical protein